MSILFVDLEDQVIEEREETGESGYLSMKEFLDSSGDGDAVAFSGFSSDAPGIKGASMLLYAFRSPMSGRNVFGHTGSYLPFSLRMRGYSALFIRGRARRLSYIALRGNSFEVRACEKFRGSSFSEFSSVVRDDENESVLATGRAADVLAPYAAAYLNGREIGIGGFGCALSLLNLKGIVFECSEPERKDSEESRSYMRRLSKSKFASRLRRESNEGAIKDMERFGCLPVDGFGRRRDARAIFLDGRYLKEKFGVYNRGCTDCPVACLRTLPDRSWCPDLFDAMALGSLLDIFSSDRVMELRSEVNDAGIERYSAAALFLALGADTPEKKSKVLREVWEEKRHFDVRYLPVGGMELALDPRGCLEEGIYAVLGITDMPLWSIYAPVRIRDPESAAVIALYERLYVLGLTDRGLPVTGAYCAYVSRFPGFLYRFPRLLRLFLGTRRMFGLKAKDILREGLRIHEAIGEADNGLPDRFVYDVDPVDPSVCEPVRMMDAWRREKAYLERKLFKEKKRGKVKEADPSVL